MTQISSNTKSDVADLRNVSYGYLTVVHVEGIGHCGGLLVLNSLGRPIEFHCTAPVPENRAQRILYGQTYESFLYCEQIGLALIGKAKKRPNMFLVNLPQLEGFGRMAQSPVLSMRAKTESQLNNAGEYLPQLANNHQFQIGDFLLCGLDQDESDFAMAKKCCVQLSKAIPIDEPFERIIQAIEEAQAVVR